MSLIPTMFQVTPIDTSPAYELPGHLGVQLSLFPPGVEITFTIPPLTIVLEPSAALELAAALLAAAESL